MELPIKLRLQKYCKSIVKISLLEIKNITTLYFAMNNIGKMEDSFGTFVKASIMVSVTILWWI